MLGELFAVGVVLMWSGSALCFDYVNQIFTPVHSNVIRFFFGLFPITLLLWCISGSPLFAKAGLAAVGWIAMAGFVGFVFGDYFLFASYRLIHASYTQLIMTLSPLFATVSAFFVLDEKLSLNVALGMLITITGIALVILTKRTVGAGAPKGVQLSVSGKGILFAVLSALGQGIGLVLSKKGIQVYHQAAGKVVTDFYISIAATQIRVIVGFLCFMFIVACSRGGMKHFLHSIQNPKVVSVTCAGAMFGLGLGVPLSLLALQYAQAAVVSTIIATVPIALLVYQRLFHHRHISLIEAAGVLLSVSGVAVMVL